MVTQELISYVKAELNKGKTREEIKQALLSGGGWNDIDVGEAFAKSSTMQGGIINPIMNLDSKIVSPVAAAPLVPPAPAPTPIPTLATPSPTVSAPIVPPPPKALVFSPISVIPPSYSNSFKNSFNIPPKKKGLSGAIKSLIIFVIIAGIIGGGWYFLGSQLSGALNSFSGSVNNFFKPAPTVVAPEVAPVVTPTPVVANPNPNPNPAPVVLSTPEPIKDCGTTVAPDAKNKVGATSDPVLICLGAHMQYCANASATLTSDIFPTQFEVIHQGDNCTFKLSYNIDSKTTSVNGNHLAGQYISCPTKIVKTIDESDPKNIVLKMPNSSNAGLYASDAYLYGTVVLFLENNFTKSKILDLGCNGNFIDSAIDGYNLMKAKK